MLACRYVLMHHGLLTAIYDNKEDLHTTLMTMLDTYHGHVYKMRKYSVYELVEHVSGSGLFLNPKQIPIAVLMQERTA